MPVGKITASCGHEVKSADDLICVSYGTETCDAVEGFIPTVVTGVYCADCADGYRQNHTVVETEEAKKQEEENDVSV